MELHEFEKYRKNRIVRRMCLILLLITVCYAAILTPLASMVASDILLAETILPLLLDAVMLYCNYAFYWLFFAALLYCVGHFEVRNCVGLLGAFVGISAFRCLCNQAAGFFVIGFPTPDTYLSDYLLPELVLPVLFDTMLIAVGGLLLVLLAYKKECEGKRVVSERLLDLHTAQGLGAFLLACIPAAIQLLSRLLYDFSVGGLPLNLADLLWIIVSYASDFLNVLIGYLVIRLLWNRIFLRETIARQEYEKTALEDRF